MKIHELSRTDKNEIISALHRAERSMNEAYEIAWQADSCDSLDAINAALAAATEALRVAEEAIEEAKK